MYNKEMFIKSITKDDQGRILLSVQNMFEAQLKEEKVRKEIKKMVTSLLGENFNQLEIGKNVCRITVNNNPDEAITQINQYIDQMLQMADQFMNQQKNNQD